MLSKVYINLIDQKEPTLDFQNQEIERNEVSIKNVLYFKKVIKPTDQEKINHEKYLKTNLKKNFFS